LALPSRITAVLASWALLLGIGLIMDQPGRPGGLALTPSFGAVLDTPLLRQISG
jgi:hypothetical protein